jgi:hypothetical protein
MTLADLKQCRKNVKTQIEDNQTRLTQIEEQVKQVEQEIIALKKAESQNNGPKSVQKPAPKKTAAKRASHLDQLAEDPEEQIKQIPISEEELTELNLGLIKNLDKFRGDIEEHAIFGILKNLERVIINRALLEHSKIGKTMTRIQEFKKDFNNDVIKQKASNLINVWRQAIKLEKAKRKAEGDRLEQIRRENDEIINAKLPWIPNDLKEDIYGLGENDKIAHKFIEVIQKHPQYAEGVRNTKDDLVKAAEVGIKITQYLVEEYDSNRYVLQNRFRTLFFALASNNPYLRFLLIKDEITPHEFIKMQEHDLANEELKKKNQDLVNYALQARRSDAVAEQISKRMDGKKTMYECSKCKSPKVTMYT